MPGSICVETGTAIMNVVSLEFAYYLLSRSEGECSEVLGRS